jgi:hypothetical protein
MVLNAIAVVNMANGNKKTTDFSVAFYVVAGEGFEPPTSEFMSPIQR